jgi:hypothetical protein
VSSQIIKKIANEISEPLAYIFNLTFLSGIIPDNLKIALVTPIFKSNEINQFKFRRAPLKNSLEIWAPCLNIIIKKIKKLSTHICFVLLLKNIRKAYV